ncbi:hypothetical protein H6F89_15485 [Cyanobacteria bacterium FACHB-63]|nr:hypothetical protein [Cyanobacteria bacterium FACHB-63]
MNFDHSAEQIYGFCVIAIKTVPLSGFLSTLLVPQAQCYTQANRGWEWVCWRGIH